MKPARKAAPATAAVGCALAVCLILLPACERTSADPEGSRYTVGGSVAGLAGTGLVLQLNGGHDLEIAGDGPFSFDAELDDGAGYHVTVTSFPSDPSQTCSVDGHEGTIAGEDALDLLVTCATDRFGVGGTVSGLVGSGLVLRLNGDHDLPIVENGPFSFDTDLDDGSGYQVSVLFQPTAPSQTCVVGEGTGTVTGQGVADVVVDCTTDRFGVGGVVDGLVGVGLVLQLDGGHDLAITGDGPFTFDTSVEDGSAYHVTVLEQPVEPDQVCDVTGESGSGRVVGGEVTDVAIRCQEFVAILEMTASRPLVSAGDDVTLSWRTRAASSCELHPGGIAVTPGASQVTVAVEASTDFSLTCQGLGGPVTRQVVVIVGDEDWASVSAGQTYSCAIKQDGRLFCWGSGLLGHGSSSGSRVPVQVGGDVTNWAQVSVGSNHTCAVTGNGRLYCWGFGHVGQLGIGGAPYSLHLERLVPAQESTGAEDWAQVTVGSEHTCAVKQDGRLYCWGDHRDGRLGVDTSEPAMVPRQESTEAQDWEQVAAGSRHTCAVKRDGRIFCWGDDRNGRLGAGEAGGGPSRVQEATEAEDWVQVTAGTSHTCAVKADGRLFCWGTGGGGQLGNGGTDESAIPVQEASEAEDWIQVAAGSNFTCAVKDGGALYCWGSGANGRIADGTSDGSLVPVQEMTGAFDWSQTSVGQRHGCAVKQSGRLYCWGWSAYVGSGDIVGSAVAVQERSAAPDWRQVDSGFAHTCAVRQDGRLFCWGSGQNGRLGTGSPEASPVPVQEATGAQDWSQVAVGRDRSCAVKEDGRLFCWGGVDGSIPVQESTEANDWAQVSAGDSHRCALKQDGSLYCWGLGTSGQLGDGHGATSSVPVREASESSDWAQVSVGRAHTCAVKEDGRLYCWGEGASGQLGNGLDDTSLVPVQEVSLATDWAQVSTGADHTCAVKRDGRLYCWGAGDGGRLGHGSEAARLIPFQESTGAEDWLQVSAGSTHTCASKRSGEIFCWGMDAGRHVLNDPEAHLNPFQEATRASNWSLVAAGNTRTFALKADGRLFGWGSDSSPAGEKGIDSLRFGPVWPTE